MKIHFLPYNLSASVIKTILLFLFLYCYPISCSHKAKLLPSLLYPEVHTLQSLALFKVLEKTNNTKIPYSTIIKNAWKSYFEGCDDIIDIENNTKAKEMYLFALYVNRPPYVTDFLFKQMTISQQASTNASLDRAKNKGAPSQEDDFVREKIFKNIPCDQKNEIYKNSKRFRATLKQYICLGLQRQFIATKAIQKSDLINQQKELLEQIEWLLGSGIELYTQQKTLRLALLLKDKDLTDLIKKYTNVANFFPYIARPVLKKDYSEKNILQGERYDDTVFLEVAEEVFCKNSFQKHDSMNILSTLQDLLIKSNITTINKSLRIDKHRAIFKVIFSHIVDRYSKTGEWDTVFHIIDQIDSVLDRCADGSAWQRCLATTIAKLFFNFSKNASYAEIQEKIRQYTPLIERHSRTQKRLFIRIAYKLFKKENRSQHLADFLQTHQDPYRQDLPECIIKYGDDQSRLTVLEKLFSYSHDAIPNCYRYSSTYYSNILDIIRCFIKNKHYDDIFRYMKEYGIKNLKKYHFAFTINCFMYHNAPEYAQRVADIYQKNKDAIDKNNHDNYNTIENERWEARGEEYIADSIFIALKRGNMKHAELFAKIFDSVQKFNKEKLYQAGILSFIAQSDMIKSMTGQEMGTLLSQIYEDEDHNYYHSRYVTVHEWKAVVCYLLYVCGDKLKKDDLCQYIRNFSLHLQHKDRNFLAILMKKYALDDNKLFEVKAKEKKEQSNTLFKAKAKEKKQDFGVFFNKDLFLSDYFKSRSNQSGIAHISLSKIDLDLFEPHWTFSATPLTFNTPYLMKKCNNSFFGANIYLYPTSASLVNITTIVSDIKENKISDTIMNKSIQNSKDPVMPFKPIAATLYTIRNSKNSIMKKNRDQYQTKNSASNLIVKS